jgi:hypothetical protein
VNDPSAALAALHRIGRERWPEASEAIRFTRAFEANPELAVKAHVRPARNDIIPVPEVTGIRAFAARHFCSVARMPPWLQTSVAAAAEGREKSKIAASRGRCET